MRTRTSSPTGRVRYVVYAPCKDKEEHGRGASARRGPVDLMTLSPSALGIIDNPEKVSSNHSYACGSARWHTLWPHQGYSVYLLPFDLHVSIWQGPFRCLSDLRLITPVMCPSTSSSEVQSQLDLQSCPCSIRGAEVCLMACHC